MNATTNGDPTSDVSLALEGYVAVVEIHRPPANYFDAALLSDIVGAITQATDLGARAAVLGSEGKHFCAGLDFGVSGQPDARSLTELYGVGRQLLDSPIPVVAAVQGSAVGGGLGLALACDFRVAAPATRFSANFARLGFHQGFGISITLPHAIGGQRALDLLTTGRRVDGNEALQIGLCDRLDEDPRAGARALADELASSAPLAVAAIRATMRRELLDAFASMVAHERDEQLRLMASDDFAEGIAASLARRSPDFQGR